MPPLHLLLGVAQVPLLLTMNEDNLALDKAVVSGDTALTQFVLLDMYQKKAGKGDFLSNIAARPVARDLFLQYCRENEPELLRDFYYSHDVLNETANLQVADAYVTICAALVLVSDWPPLVR